MRKIWHWSGDERGVHPICKNVTGVTFLRNPDISWQAPKDVEWVVVLWGKRWFDHLWVYRYGQLIGNLGFRSENFNGKRRSDHCLSVMCLYTGGIEENRFTDLLTACKVLWKSDVYGIKRKADTMALVDSYCRMSVGVA